MHKPRKDIETEEAPIEEIAHVTPKAKMYLERRYIPPREQAAFEDRAKSLDSLSESYIEKHTLMRFS